MKRSDDVFLFTLVDFLLQVFFFGLFLYVASLATAKGEEETRKAKDTVVERASKWSGISNITELTDLFTKMAPLDKLRGMSDFLLRSGGEQKIADAMAIVNQLGGLPELKRIAAENQQLKVQLANAEGWGKVSCLPLQTVGGKLSPKPIAVAVVSDTSIKLESPAPEFTHLLQSHGLTFEQVQQLSLGDFRRVFAPVVAKQPECRYFLSARRATNLYEPMSTLWSAFRSL